MRLRFITMLCIAAALAIATACGGSSGHDAAPQPTIDVSGLTPGVIADRALAALQREGMVTHITEVQSGSGLDGTYGMWIDWNGKRVRLDEGGYATRILANGNVSFREDQKSIDVPAGDVSDVEKMFSGFAFSPIDYLMQLRKTKVVSFTINSAETEGHQAILADVIYEYALPGLEPLAGADATAIASPPAEMATAENKIYLDAGFLPIRLETVDDGFRLVSSHLPVSSFTTEFVPASALAGDFFDKTAAFGIGQSPMQRLAFARDTGFSANWLGEEFENATLTSVSGERAATRYESGARVVTVEYAKAGADASGLPCGVYLRNYPKAIWREVLDRRKESPPFDDKPKPDRELEDFDVPGGHAQIIEEHRIDILPPTPGATPTEWPTLVPSVRPSLEDLPPMPPRGDVADTVGRLTTKDYVVEVHLSCRASFDEKVEPLKRILAALRPYPE